MKIIVNGFVKPIDAPDIERGSVLIDNGAIVAVGRDITIPEGAEIIDATGLIVTPGLVDGHCHIGMREEIVGAAGDDTNEKTDPLTPQMRAIDAINPADAAFYDALTAGVTTAVTGPGSTNVIGGQFAAIKTAGTVVDDMVILAPTAMKCAFGENPRKTYSERKAAPMTRMAIAALLRDTLYKTKCYAAEKQAALEKGIIPKFDFKLEAMLPVINGEIPLKAHAHRLDDMFTALRIADEFGVKLTLDHCTEGHLEADRLKRSSCCGFFVGPSFGARSKYELKEKSFNTAAAFYKAGIEFAIVTDAPVVPIAYLPMCAAYAIKAGVPEDAAWRAITLTPAKITGIADRIGSLTPGKDADVALFSGNPLRDYGAKAVMTLVNGNTVYNGK